MSINLMPAAKISSTGIEAERKRMDIIANNLANINSSAGPDGKVFSRQIPVFREVMTNELGGAPGSNLNGVKLDKVVSDGNAPIEMYAPYHPDANQDGMVQMPNISPIEEMVDMISATRAYEANLAVMKESRKLADKQIAMLKNG